MNNKSLVTNFIWRFLERCGAQGVTFVVSIVLARLLDPAVYGTVALVTVFTTIMQVFIESGFGTALIQKKEADDLDFSTVFYFNIIMSVLLYALMFFTAPLIAAFYKIEELTLLIRVMSLSLLVSGVKNVQQAYISRTMQFKRFFFSTIGATISAAVVGIAMAYSGMGVWALVGQSLTSTAISTAILWLTVKWRPKKMFSFERLKGLFSYGWKLLVSAFLETVYNDIRQLIIGKMYSSADLAYYNKGKQLPQLLITNINTSIDSILLPTMSMAQDDVSQVKAMTRRSMKISTYVMVPIMAGLAVCAEPLISFLYTDKWLFCVPYLRIFCFTFMFYPIHTANLNAMKAMGRSDLFLKLEIVKKVVGLAAILVTMWHSVMAMALSLVVTTILNSIINAFPNKKILNYGYFEQIKDLLPSILLGVVMGGVVYCITFLNLPAIITLLIQVPLGVIMYISCSIIFKNDNFKYVFSTVKGYLKKH